MNSFKDKNKIQSTREFKSVAVNFCPENISRKRCADFEQKRHEGEYSLRNEEAHICGHHHY